MTSPFPTAFAVPVWVAVSETPELTGSGTVTDEERVDGLLRLDNDGLTLEGELVQSTTTLDGRGQRTEKESLGTHEFRIPFDQLVSITAHRRLFWPCLKIQASTVTAVQGLPGAKQGQVKVRVSMANWRAARTLVAELEIARADLALENARQLERSDPPRLSS